MVAATIQVATETPVSEEAKRVWDVLGTVGAFSPHLAVPDREIAKRANVPQRNVIDLAKELAAAGRPVISACGSRNGSRAGKGRYIERDPSVVRAYGDGLHRRAKSIHVRARVFLDLADRMDATRKVDSRGQGRLFP